MIEEYVKIEVECCVNVAEEVIVREGVPKGIVPIRGIPIYAALLDDSIPSFADAGLHINIHGPPIFKFRFPLIPPREGLK
jgi:hypothetical protein